MAEFVQQNIEETIPELEQLERVGLFAKEEIKAIIKRRTHHEYRLVRRQRDKEDFLKYIQYEVNLLHLIKKRRNRLHYFFKKDEIEMTIITRILRLFRRTCTQNPEDLKLWSSYIEFARTWHMMQELSRVFTRLLKVHSDKPALWIMAAKFQMEENSSSENARGLMLRALRHHPKSHKLWTEYFRLELMNADKQRKRYALLKQSQIEPDEDDMNDAVMQGAVAQMVYKQAMQQMSDDIDLHLAFLPICQRFDFTQHILDEIYSDLEESHADSELVWNALSRRHLSPDSEESEESIVVTEEGKCHTVFDEAVKSIPTPKMWSMYVEFCIERLERGGSVKTSNQRARQTLNVLDRAHKACDTLPEELFDRWLTVLLIVGGVDEAISAAQEAVTVHPTSVNLWCRYMQLVIQNITDAEQQKTNVTKLFEKACSNLKSKNSLPLWKIAMEWCLASDPANLETLLQTGVREHKHVAMVLKEHYLDWAYLQGGLKTVRRVYSLLAKEKPLTTEFFYKYIAIENAQTDTKMKQIRSCYEDALREFGTTEPDLWLDFIKLELTHPNGNPSNSPSLHWRAMQALQGDHVETFTIKYTLMQTGHCS
ncbi:U3 small nucleolar RNA-associated protein 6 homolog [Amphiura filiformis]|uniref:U3 small nucleolar RNA-associated protein 6 homolog n=1 Tax=Amphiura filiformis TaxID=82378 RepID=UPI003B220E65